MFRKTRRINSTTLKIQTNTLNKMVRFQPFLDNDFDKTNGIRFQMCKGGKTMKIR